MSADDAAKFVSCVLFEYLKIEKGHPDAAARHADACKAVDALVPLDCHAGLWDGARRRAARAAPAAVHLALRLANDVLGRVSAMVEAISDPQHLGSDLHPLHFYVPLLQQAQSHTTHPLSPLPRAPCIVTPSDLLPCAPHRR